MFRTRDFILVFVSVVFLMVAISSTVAHQNSNSLATDQSLILADVTDTDYSADVQTPETLNREERLAAMKEKIAASQAVSLSAPTGEVASEEVEQIETVSSSSVIDNVLLEPVYCTNYTSYSGVWPTSGVQLEMIEGARVVYHEVLSASSIDILNPTSSTPLSPNVLKEVLLQLPVRSVSDNKQHCLASDVIGIAQDGSLIKNSEAGLYGVFSSDTIVGYALDGFPIYGLSDELTDQCGGTSIGGLYRYYISKDRSSILNCFVTTPVNI